MQPDEQLLFELLAGLPIERDVTGSVSGHPDFEDWPFNPDHSDMSAQSQAMEVLLSYLQQAGVKPPLPADFLDRMGYNSTPDGTPFLINEDQQGNMTRILRMAMEKLGIPGLEAFRRAEGLSERAITNPFETQLGVKYGEDR